jgi:hypothetical protein
MITLRAFLAVFAIGALGGVPLAQQGHDAHPPAAAEPAVTQAQEHEMSAMRDRMMAEMKAMDATLDGLVAKMNGAEGDAKVAAMADVIAALVEQRSAMRDRQMQMHTRMMGHMMQHMAGGMAPGAGKRMMSQCPMMKGTETGE